MQKVKQSCRKLAQKLSYMDTPWVEPAVPARSGGTSSGSLRTPADSSQPVTGATSAVHTPPHHSAGKGPATKDGPLGFRTQHDQWDNWPQDEINMCQLGGAPLGTQGASQVLTNVVSLNT